MDDGAVRRLSAIAGGCVFALALLVQLARPDLGTAVLVSLACGLVAGVTVYLAGTVVLLSRPVEAVKPPAPPPPPDPDETQELPDLGTIKALEETREIPKEEVEGADAALGEGLDMQQTVHLDDQGLQNLIPGITAEDLEKEKEDLARMMAEQGIEGEAVASENKEREKA